MEKTNVMRILDQKKIVYNTHSYAHSEAVSGMDVAEFLHQDPCQVFKTLVAVGGAGKHYVFVVPVCKELNLKKAAKLTGEKKIEMLKAKELLPLTGYIHGGCSPIGMKKRFDTFLDSSAANWPTIIFSAGKIGWQVEMALSELKKVIPFQLGDVSDDE